MKHIREERRIDLRERKRVTPNSFFRVFSFILVFLAVIIIYGQMTFLALHSEGDLGSIYAPIYHIIWEEEDPHLETPEQLRALYLTSWTAGSGRMDSLVKNAKEAGMNALVIDVKDATGYVSFPLEDTPLAHYETGSKRIPHIQKLIEKLHKEGFYLIARIVCFQDPLYSKKHPEIAIHTKDGSIWKNKRGRSFLNPKKEEARKYIADLARYSYQLGFDEVNFDYIRYPSDGDLSTIDYELEEGEMKRDVIHSFAEFLYSRLHNSKKDYIPTSADVFGFVATRDEIPSIGQRLEDFFPYFDAVAPMVYPSHYPKTYRGFANPAEHPYTIVLSEMKRAKERLDAFLAERENEKGDENVASQQLTQQENKEDEEKEHTTKLRTWIQDFSLHTHYTADMVRKELEASYDAGVDSFMVWSPNNRYTWEAYKRRRGEE